MGQGASRASDAQREGGADEEAASNSPRLLSEDSDEERRAQDGAAAPNPPLAHLPAQPADAVVLDVAPAAPAPAAPEGAAPAAPDVYFGAAFLPEGFVPAPQDALLLGLRPELAALVSNGTGHCFTESRPATPRIRSRRVSDFIARHPRPPAADSGGAERPRRPGPHPHPS